MSRRKAIKIAAALFVIVAAVCYFFVYTTREYTCLECRATLEKRRVCGIPFQWVVQNSYSQSVQSRKPSHQHQWCWSGSTSIYSLTSFVFGCGRRHAIWWLPVRVQAEYSRLVSESELHDTLQAIDSSDGKIGREIVNKVYERVFNEEARRIRVHEGMEKD